MYRCMITYHTIATWLCTKCCILIATFVVANITYLQKHTIVATVPGIAVCIYVYKYACSVHVCIYSSNVIHTKETSCFKVMI